MASTEPLDPILMSQPLFYPSQVSPTILLPNIVSQLCTIIVDNRAQPQLADLEESLPDQAPQVANTLINSLLAKRASAHRYNFV